ncbi:DUF2339 domain-containing protein [Ravibacter arvi]|uniref:DUF2339 domain-containing protein n=1 Tax=Ravibacter arvi TaxID=2051041 RepID=A0ABP8LKQ4_9BACT
MDENQEQVDRLQQRLEALTRQQNEFAKEISQLRRDLYELKSGSTPVRPPVPGGLFDTPASKSAPAASPVPGTGSPRKGVPRPSFFKKKPGLRSNFERFIGENLINKIGILITVIGVGVGAKYAIDNQLISPLTRIILGYVVGAGLLGFAIRLKQKYENYSAVLLSGAMAIFYFITFAAYDLYGLIPQEAAFGLMVVFTLFTVVAALNYQKQVIAVFGLVGAYAVPFLLGDNNGSATFLFSYMVIINVGILAVSLKKYWKLLYFSSFAFTWLIYLVWYWTDYRTTRDFSLALSIASIFFLLFYLAFLGYKLIRKENFEKRDIVLLLANSFIFYGIGYALVEQLESGNQVLGLYTLAHAIVHFLVSLVIFKQKLADKNLFFFVTGLVLVFLTVAAPVQLDGNWVTLLWIGLATLVFWLGRTKEIPFYEKLAYPLIVLALGSLADDWSSAPYHYYNGHPETRLKPLFNINFLTSALFAAALGWINYLHRDTRYQPSFSGKKMATALVDIFLPASFLLTLFFTFQVEIATYWNQLYADSAVTVRASDGTLSSPAHDEDLRRFESVWQICYCLLFLSLLAFINLTRINSRWLGMVNLALLVVAILSFLTDGLYELSVLRSSYLAPDDTYEKGMSYLSLRYISYVFAGLALAAAYRYFKSPLMPGRLKTLPFELLLHVSVLWIASSELIHWMEMARSTQSDKLGLSILWGVYALLLISLGIYQKKKYLRIGAIALFGVTLVKLFFYDISHLDTIAKTIVLVSLGILLLVISFLYNKYKHLIADETES